MENQQERLQELEKRQDWPGLAKAYYELGCQAMDQGRLEQAALWLHRADTVYSAQDETYEAVDDQLIDDCSDRIGQLEEAPMLYNQIPERIEQAAEEMDDLLVRLWGLLSLSDEPAKPAAGLSGSESAGLGHRRRPSIFPGPYHPRTI